MKEVDRLDAQTFLIKDTSWVFGLKGMAILGIILYHWFSRFGFSLISLVARIGGQGVHVFFILSGFGLYFSISQSSEINWRSWFKKRFQKLLIPYYMSIFLTIAIYAFISFKTSTQRLDWQAIIASFFLYRNFIPEYVMAVNSPWWFVITILELYCVFPFLLSLFKKVGARKFLFISFLITFLYEVSYGITVGPENLVFARFFLCFLFEFCLGIVLADIFLNSLEKFKRITIGRMPFLVGISSEIIGGYLGLKGGLGIVFNDMLNALGYFLLSINFYYVIVKKINLLKRFLEYTGKRSLGLFLLHVPLIEFFELGFAITLWRWIFLLPFYLIVVFGVNALFMNFLIKKNPFVKDYFVINFKQKIN